MAFFSFKRRLLEWGEMPGNARRLGALLAGALGFFLVGGMFLAEALTLFGTLNPAQTDILRRYADIPEQITDAIAWRFAFGTLTIYFLVAAYFGFVCALVLHFWNGDRRPPSPRLIGGIVVSLFAWVLVSATLKLLAVHPYATDAMPFLKGIERVLRSWWTPTWALAVTLALGAFLSAAFSCRDSWGAMVRRGALLCLFFPLLGPSVSTLSVAHQATGGTASVDGAPPVVVIGIDSLRRDHVSRWGGPQDLTPHLDAFLAEAYEFTNAWTVVGRTHPSYVSFLTGRTPDRHGVRYNRADPFFADRLPKTLGHVLIEAGYSTRYLTDDNMFSSMGRAHGYQNVGQQPTMLETYAAKRFMSFFFLSTLPARYTSGVLPALKHNRAVHSNYDSKDFSDAVIAAIEEEDEKSGPFFVTAHLCTIHFPGSQPGPEFRAHQPSKAPAIDYFKASLSHLKDGEMHVSSARDERLRGLYKSGVQRADAELGRILAHLRGRGLMERAWVVVWSDHGEAFSDSKGKPILPSHGLAVDEGGKDLKIVLGIRPPRGQHRRIEDAVGSIDVAPTLLAALGLPKLPGEREGRSLQPLLVGKGMEEPILYAESGTHWGRKLDAEAAGYDFDLLRLYRFDEATGELLTRRHFHDKLVINKQRMVQHGEFRLLYEPMLDGSKRRRFFQWNRGAMPAPDVRAEHPEIFEKLNRELDAHLVDLDPRKLAEGVKRDDLRSPWLPWLPGTHSSSTKRAPKAPRPGASSEDALSKGSAAP